MFYPSPGVQGVIHRYVLTITYTGCYSSLWSPGYRELFIVIFYPPPRIQGVLVFIYVLPVVKIQGATYRSVLPVVKVQGATYRSVLPVARGAGYYLLYCFTRRPRGRVLLILMLYLSPGVQGVNYRYVFARLVLFIVMCYLSPRVQGVICRHVLPVARSTGGHLLLCCYLSFGVQGVI